MKLTLKHNKKMKEYRQLSLFEYDLTWPICIYDFSCLRYLPSMFVFKVERDLDDYILPDYFVG